jgi:hypothetical protein
MPRGMTRTLERAATRTVGLQSSVTGLTRRTFGGNGVYRTLFTFAAMPITVTDALAYASQKIFDFPLGRINIKGGRASLAFAVTSVRASTINDSAAMDWSVGTAAASATTLATTMLDIVAKQDHTLDGAVAAYTAAVAAAVAAAAAYDGTGTAKDAYLNVSFPTGTDIDGDGTLAVNGTIELHWENWGLAAPAA